MQVYFYDYQCVTNPILIFNGLNQNYQNSSLFKSGFIKFCQEFTKLSTDYYVPITLQKKCPNDTWCEFLLISLITQYYVMM